MPRLGIVSGRRRQGKSYLLRRLCAHAAVDGLYVLAQEHPRQVALHQFADALSAQVFTAEPGDRPVTLLANISRTNEYYEDYDRC